MSISSSEWLISVRRSSPKRSEISLELLLDHGEHAGLIAKDRPQLGDSLGDVAVLLFDPVGLERGQLGEAQIEDRGRLDGAQLEARDQLLARGIPIARGPDQFDDRVEVLQCRQQALEDVGAGLLLGELVLGPTDDHLALVAT